MTRSEHKKVEILPIFPANSPFIIEDINITRQIWSAIVDIEVGCISNLYVVYLCEYWKLILPYETGCSWPTIPIVHSDTLFKHVPWGYVASHFRYAGKDVWSL